MNILYLGALLLVYSTSVVMANSERTVFDPAALRTFAMPESCQSEGMEFCFEKENYPDDIVEELMKDITNLVVSEEDVAPMLTYADRQGVTSDEDECASRSNNNTIYYIKDEAGSDRVVVQLKGKFEQRFSVVWCEQKGALTSRSTHFLKSTVSKYNLTCENKYMNYDFFVLSSEPDMNGKWKMETARTKTGIPVCCACRYEKTSKHNNSL